MATEGSKLWIRAVSISSSRAVVDPLAEFSGLRGVVLTMEEPSPQFSSKLVSMVAL